MKILIYFGHPAQYLFMRAAMRMLIDKGHKIKILIKTKDVLERLLENDGLEYTNILTQERGASKFAIGFSILKRTSKILPIVSKFKPDIMIGTDATIAHIGKLLNIHRVTITEDDFEVIKTLGKLTYPFTETILCPEVCQVGKWEKKKVGYAGYMKLAYLHLNIFTLNNKILEKYQFQNKYVIIRLAKLTAHHDFGIKGISLPLLDSLISILEKKSYQVLLSVEGDIPEKYKQYILKINPNDMHHVLAGSSLLVCDSQSMSVEAAMLGVPSIRYSSFSGRISVLEELEHKYQLTYGIKSGEEEKLISKLKEILEESNLKKVFQNRRKIMLADKIDVTGFLIWFIENYPKSVQVMKENPDYQYNFK